MPYYAHECLDSYAKALIEDHLEYMKDDDQYKEQANHTTEFLTFLDYFDDMFCDENKNPCPKKILEFLKDELEAGDQITPSSTLYQAIVNELKNTIIPDTLIDDIEQFRFRIIEDTEIIEVKKEYIKE
jgi:hypothetical protein